MRRILSILLLLCASLCARPNVYIPAVELNGVHQDYADRIVRWTKDYLESKKDVLVVENEKESDFILQITMLRKDNGVLIAYSLKNSDDKAEVLNYKHMAYSPDDLAPVADVATMKFGQWNGVRLGVGLGTIGLFTPEFAVAPAVDFVVNFLCGNFLFSLDANWGIDEGLGDDDFSYFGAFLSAAYVFGGRTVFPYVGPGAGLIYLDYDSEKYGIDEAPEGYAFLLKVGVFLKPVDYKTIFALDVRYLFNICNLEKVPEEGYSNAHGWSVSAQVWW